MKLSVTPPEEWDLLGEPAPRSLTRDRLQLHWAAQVLASFGQALIEPRADDSHRSMSWDPLARELVTDAASDAPDLRLALSPDSLELRVHGGAGAGQEESYSLLGTSLESAYGWAGEALGRARSGETVELVRPEYEMPGHPVGERALFDASGAGLSELGRWYHDAHLALEAFRGAEPRASAIRVWPHHFDIATLAVVRPATDSESMRSVGVGFSPGDGSYDEPYAYVNAWPPPAPERLPQLVGPGHWHTEGWIGAVLLGSDVGALPGAAAQAGMVADFLAEAGGQALELAGV